MRSGTTGAPKGVEITHLNLMTSIAGSHNLFKQANLNLGPGDSMLGYLPMAHIFDRLIEELLLSLGSAVGYWRVRACWVRCESCVRCRSGLCCFGCPH